MDEATLVRRLESLAPADLEGARERAQLALRVGLAAPRAAAPRHLRLAMALPVVCLLAAVAALTPAGQAAVAWVGERVGIGEPGGRPTLEALRRDWQRTSSGSGGGTAYVLAAGAGPHGGRYELVTYAEPSQEARCFELDMTRERSGYGFGCERLPGAAGLPLEPPLPAAGGLQATWGGNVEAGQGLRYVAGRVSEDVASVSVEFRGEAVPVELVSIPPALFDELGIERHFKFFIGFSADWRRAGSFEVSAENGAGEVVAHESLEVPAPMLRPVTPRGR